MGMFRVLPPAKKVLTPEDASGVIERLGRKPIFGVDTETTGLSRPKDRAIILALSDGIDRWAVWDTVLPYFKKLLEDPEKDLVFHNANYDSWMLANVNIDVYAKAAHTRYRCYDTMIMHALLNDAAPHGLKDLTKQFLGIDMVPFREVFNLSANKASTSQDVLLNPDNSDITANYASLDAYATMLLYYEFKDALRDMPAHEGMSMWDYYMRSELPFTKILWGMERNGFLIDTDSLLEMAPLLEEEMLRIKKWFGKQTGRLYVNLNSTAEMIEIFYGMLGYKVTERTDGGDPSLTEKVVKKWAHSGCEYAKKYLRHSELGKQLNTYILNIYRRVHTDGRIHGTFNQAGARTGRLSSSDPNLQNQPAFIREAYIAATGMKIFAADYSQLEMRILAHQSGDNTIINAIIDGLDIHCATAATMFGVSYDKIKAAKVKDDNGDKLSSDDKKYLSYRKASKAIGFGLMYGQGAFKLAQTLGVSKKEAKKLMTKFFSSFTSITSYFNNAIEEARHRGYCTTLMGRRRLVGGFRSYFQSDVAAAERKVKNTPIQGSAADIVKWGMIKLYEDDYLRSTGAKMQVQVHDEVVWEVPDDVADDPYFMSHVQKVMGHPLDFDLLVPLDTSAKFGSNWKQCK